MTTHVLAGTVPAVSALAGDLTPISASTAMPPHKRVHGITRTSASTKRRTKKGWGY